MRLLALAILLVPATAFAGDFVYDAGAIPNSPKSDYTITSIPATKKIVASDWNSVVDALVSLRNAALSGYYHGLAPISAPPPAPSSGLILFSLADGGGVWVENSAGLSLRIATESELPIVQYWNDGGPGQITSPSVIQIPAIDAGNLNVATANFTGNISFPNASHVTGTSLEFQIPVQTDNTVTSAVAVGGTAFATSNNGVKVGVGSSANQFFISDGGAIGTPANLYSLNWMFVDSGEPVLTAGEYTWNVGGRIDDADSPQVAFFYAPPNGAHFNGCSYSWTTGSSSATGSLTVNVGDWDNADAILCGPYTLRCDGKWPDGGVGDGAISVGDIPCTSSVLPGHHVYLGTSSTCSTRPKVNYTCRFKYP